MTLTERMKQSLIVHSNGCWEWTGYVRSDGYGQISVDGKPGRTHVVAYELWVGPVPEGRVVDHTCHDQSCPSPGNKCLHRRCCNPSHLRVTTLGENVLAGYGPAAINARKTHCPRGHTYTGRSLLGYRKCQTCNTEDARNKLEKQRGGKPRWNTQKTRYSGESNPNARLTLVQARDIRRRASAGEGYTALAKEFRVSNTMVRKIALGRAWKETDTHV